MYFIEMKTFILFILLFFQCEAEMSSVATLVYMYLRKRLCTFTDQIPVVLQLNMSPRCTIRAINYNHKYAPNIGDIQYVDRKCRAFDDEPYPVIMFVTRALVGKNRPDDPCSIEPGIEVFSIQVLY